MKLFMDLMHVYMRKSRLGVGAGAGGPDPLKNHKNIVLLSNTGPDHLKNHKATKRALNVGLSSGTSAKRHLMAICWWADDGPLIVVFGSFLPLSTREKKLPKLVTIWQNFLDPHMVYNTINSSLT